MQVRVIPCACGGIPTTDVYRVAEDCMGAQASCPKCGKTAEEIEHVWGGAEARVDALHVWNGMRQAEIATETGNG